MKHGFSGLVAWAVQRGSALYMLAFVLAAGASLADPPRGTFAAWTGGVHSPVVSACSALFVCALCSHLWVGLRDVLLDYARPAPVRGALLVALAALLVSMAAWALIVLFVPGT